MHAWLTKTEWRSCSSAMATSWGVLLRALDKWYLLVRVNSFWDPHLSMDVISDSSGNVCSRRGCGLLLAPLFAQTWSAHTLPLTFSWRRQSRPTEKAWYGWQRQINGVYLPAGDRTLQPTHAEMWRWLTREMNVSRNGHTIQNKKTNVWT